MDDLQQDTGEENPDFELPLLLDEIQEGDSFVIENIRIEEGSQNIYAVLEIKGQEYRTSSQVIIDQLKNILTNFEEEDTLKATIDSKISESSGRKYYRLV